MLPSIDDFIRLSDHLGFERWPRSIGNPRQQFVYAPEDVYRAFRKWDGESSCFISTQGYDDLHHEQGRQIPRSIVYGLTFFDFDHETKAENAFADAQRLSQFLRDLNVAHWVQYSGSKGYHLFVVHEPTRFKFTHRDGSADALRHLVNQTQTHLKKTLGLNTLDEQTTGDPKRLCRFPYSQHVGRTGEVSGRHAFPIPPRILNSRGHDEIVAMSYRPRLVIPKVAGTRLTLRSFIELLDVKLHKPETNLRPVIDGDFALSEEGMETLFLGSLEQKCPGVVNELKRTNPPHKARVHTALFAKSIGMSQQEFERIWVAIGTERGYVDLHNHEHRQYQMATLFDNPRYASVANCWSLKADGCCIGEACPKFKDMSSMGEERTIKRRWKRKAS